MKFIFFFLFIILSIYSFSITIQSPKNDKLPSPPNKSWITYVTSFIYTSPSSPAPDSLGSNQSWDTMEDHFPLNIDSNDHTPPSEDPKIGLSIDLERPNPNFHLPIATFYGIGKFNRMNIPFQKMQILAQPSEPLEPKREEITKKSSKSNIEEID